MTSANCFRLADAVQRAMVSFIVPRLTEEILWMDGYTSPAQRSFLNALCNHPAVGTYLEIGIFQGASLLAAAYHNKGNFVGVDNFCEGTRQAAYANLRGVPNVRVVEGDIWHMDSNLLPVPDVLFFDANTSDSASSKVLLFGGLYLPTDFIVIVDNWSYATVRQRFHAAIQELDWTVFAGYQFLSADDCHIHDFGSGWYVAVISRLPMRSTTPETMVPIVPGDIPLYALRRRRAAGLVSISDYAKLRQQELENIP